MCVILPVDHLSCSHTVAVWHHCQRAPKTKLLGPAPCGRIRQHTRPILTRKLCHNCGGPRLLNFRKSIDIGRIKEEESNPPDSGYSTTRESLDSTPSDKSNHSESITEEEEETEDARLAQSRQSGTSDQENLFRRDPAYRPHIYRNGHWTPRRGSEISSSTRSKRTSTVSRSIYSEAGSEVSEFEDSLGKARSSDWPKSPTGIHLHPGSHLLKLRFSGNQDSNNSFPDSPQEEQEYWDTEDTPTITQTSYLDTAPNDSDDSEHSNSNSVTNFNSDDSDSASNYSTSSQAQLSDAEDEQGAPNANANANTTDDPKRHNGHPGDENAEPSPSPFAADRYAVIMATTAKMGRASRISFHGPQLRVLDSEGQSKAGARGGGLAGKGIGRGKGGMVLAVPAGD